MTSRPSAIGVVAIATLAAIVPSQAAGRIGRGNFEFTTFDVGAGVIEDVRSINNAGIVVGSASFDLQGLTAIQGFERFPDGNIVPVIDPAAGSTALTRAYGINEKGTIAGQFADLGALDDRRIGFFATREGHFTSFDVPGDQGFGMGVSALNDKRDFCGWLRTVDLPPGFEIGFVSLNGDLATFFLPNAVKMFPAAIDKRGTVAGYYSDFQGVFHGFIRSKDGVIVAPVDVPNASALPGQGTVLYGLNDSGDMSGHFWDGNGRQHGFLVTNRGEFLQIDVPGAQFTGGSGINDEREVAGSYLDENGVVRGYIARFARTRH